MWYSADQLYSGAWEPQSSCKVLIKPNIFIKYSISPKVLRPGLVAGPVQGSGSGFWPGHRVWPGRPGQFFKKKNQNDVVLVKKKTKKTKANGFVTGSWPGLARSAGSPGHTGFFLPPFFRQPGPVPAPGRPGPGSTRQAGPCRVSKLWFHP